MINKKMNVFWPAVVMILMIAPLALFAGGQKEEPAVTAPEKEPETKVLPEAAEPEAVTITDSSGREVTINKPVESIVL